MSSTSRTAGPKRASPAGVQRFEQVVADLGPVSMTPTVRVPGLAAPAKKEDLQFVRQILEFDRPDNAAPAKATGSKMTRYKTTRSKGAAPKMPPSKSTTSPET